EGRVQPLEVAVGVRDAEQVERQREEAVTLGLGLLAARDVDERRSAGDKCALVVDDGRGAQQNSQLATASGDHVELELPGRAEALESGKGLEPRAAAVGRQQVM